mgnify:CR=1 FL=1
MKNILTVLTLATLFSACSLFSGGSSRTKNYTNQIVSGDISTTCIDGTANCDSDRIKEISNAIKTNFTNIASSGSYNYGTKAQTTASTFTVDKLKLLVSSCSNNQTKCSLNLFVDRASASAIRPLFAIDGKTATSSSCDSKYKAYVSSVVMLSKEAVTPISHSYNDITNPTLICSDITLGATTQRHDYLCVNKSIIQTVTKYQTLDVSLGTENFSVSLPSTDSMVDLKYTSTGYMVCIDKMLKASMWKKNRKNSPTDIAVFKVSLKMVQ